MVKALIGTELIVIRFAKENIIFSVIILIVKKSGEVFSKKWDVKYDLRNYDRKFYFDELKHANKPAYRPARGRMGIKYSGKKEKKT